MTRVVGPLLASATCSGLLPPSIRDSPSTRSVPFAGSRRVTITDLSVEATMKSDPLKTIAAEDAAVLNRIGEPSALPSRRWRRA